ncbi:MAG: hypothetical protein PHH57_07780 [Candidatus Omnitrophica bacterium]|nr:hypothetical protein [Candidatus Omnitrophota bacterium]
MKASCGATRHFTHEFKRTPGRPPKVEPVYIACADLDFTWTRAQVKRAVEIYRECSPLEAVRRIADEFRRRDEEAGILIMDLGMKGVL